MKPINWNPKLREAFDNLGAAIVIYVFLTVPMVILFFLILFLVNHIEIRWK